MVNLESSGVEQRAMARFQSHGVVLFVSDDGTVRNVSQSGDGVLGRPAHSAVGEQLQSLLPGVTLDGLISRDRDAFVGPAWHLASSVTGVPLKVRAFDAGSGLTGIDVIAIPASDSPSEALTVERITRWTARLQAASDRTELMEAVSAVAVSLTGFEGAWAVRIEADGNGYVEAATVSGGAPDTTGSVASAIHLPPGDLTIAARPAPFFVADVAESAVDLEPASAPALDLSGSSLHRPFDDYLAFLASIGARSTFSIPITVGGRTWARLIGHDPAPRVLGPAMQSELRLVGIAAGVRLEELLNQEANAERLSLAVTSAKVLRGIAAAGTLAEGFRADPAALLEFCAASSVIVTLDGDIAVEGKALPELLVTALLRDARVKFASHDRFVVATATMPFASDGHAGGYLAVRLDEAATDLLLWVRPERRRTVQWVSIADHPEDAGPNRQMSDAVGQVERSESSSSDPWTEAQVQAVEAFRNEIASVVLARYGALQQANTDLRRSNTEFDAFAHTVAHDLRAPLRGITQYTEFFLEDAASRLIDDDVEQLETVLRLAGRGTALLDDLLRYAQLGEATWTIERIDLERAVAEALEQLDRGAVASAVVEVEPGEVTADPSALRQLLANLIGNAIKYTDGAARIRIGLTSLAQARTSSAPPASLDDLPSHAPVLRVEDEGVGIGPEHVSRVFGLFKRANVALPEVEGTGAGLAMCRRIAQRHGGDIWLTSVRGEGTTVFCVLGP